MFVDDNTSDFNSQYIGLLLVFIVFFLAYQHTLLDEYTYRQSFSIIW